MRLFTLQRRHVLLCLFVLWISLVAGATTSAQNAAIPLAPGTAISGSLDADAMARVYIFSAGAGDTIDLTATAQYPLALLLTDTSGAIYGQASDTGTAGTVSLTGISLASAGTYFVTVYPAPGADVSASGAFELTLDVTSTTSTPEGTAEPGATPGATLTYQQPQEISIQNGMEVRLEWSAAVDLNLEVRDPQGNPLYWDSTTSPINGTFGFDANGLCEIISETPQETASWTPGFLPTGSYEILVFYRQSCGTGTAQPVDFTVTATVNGVVLNPIRATLVPPLNNQNSVYVLNFVMNDDGSAVINNGGNYPDTSLNIVPATPQEVLASAQPITPDTPITGSIVGGQYYQSYSFDATANELVSVTLSRTAGSLDTLLQLVDANGAIVAVSDDEGDSTNSALSNVRLPVAGKYTLIATRYGKEIGGTEGTFDLTLSGGSGELPTEVAGLNLPEGAVAISLSWNTNADIQLLVRDPVGDSVFDDEPSVNSGGILALGGNVNCTPAANNQPVSYIYWPFLRPGTYEIEVWYQNNCNDTRQVQFNLNALVNKVPVVSETQTPTPNQTFVITFTVNADGTATSADGGYASDDVTSFNFLSEDPLALTVNQAVTGQIGSGETAADNYFNVYAFAGTAGQKVTISMNTTSGILDPKLFLVSPTGLQVAQNDDAVPGSVKNALINEFTLQQDGVYQVIATRYGIQYGGTTGTYTLNVQQN